MYVTSQSVHSVHMYTYLQNRSIQQKTVQKPPKPAKKPNDFWAPHGTTVRVFLKIGTPKSSKINIY